MTINTDELVQMLAPKANPEATLQELKDKQLDKLGDFVAALYLAHTELAAAQTETQRQLKVLQTAYLNSQQDPLEADFILDRLERVETQMASTRNSAGYCLRKVREAVDTDPQNAYLAKIFDAIDSLDSKLS